MHHGLVANTLTCELSYDALLWRMSFKRKAVLGFVASGTLW
jgi:hypothetical protein